MPRIPATIAVVMLVATCIGFNTARFPVVLEMAAIPTVPSMTKVVICSEASPVSEDSIDTDSSYSSYSYSSDNGYESSSDGQSGYSSYGNDSNGGSSHKSYESNGSHDCDDGSGSSDEEAWSSNDSDSYAYGEAKDESTDDNSPSSYGYGQDSSSYGEDASSYEYGYDSGNESSTDDDDSRDSKWNRRNKNRSKGKTKSGKASENSDYSSAGNSYAWQDSSDATPDQDSEYDPYGSSDTDSDSHDSYGSGDSDDWSQEDAYASDSSYNDNDSVTRYDERQEAAVDDASTWSGGAPVTASPAAPYAYGSHSYEDSAAASANVVPKSGNLALVPVEDEPQSNGTWGNGSSNQGHDSRYSSNPENDGIYRSHESPAPAGFSRLPPVDRSVRGPVLSPLADGSIPLYPSTGAF